MNILLFRYGSICEPDIIETFQKFGFTVDEITEFKENKNLSDSDCIELVSRHILTKEYAFVFTINFFPWLSHLCNIKHIPYLCLTVDSPVIEFYNDAIKNHITAFLYLTNCRIWIFMNRIWIIFFICPLLQMSHVRINYLKQHLRTLGKNTNAIFPLSARHMRNSVHLIK